MPQLKEAPPSELVLLKIAPALFVVKLAQMLLAVYGRAAAPRHVAFLDRLYGRQATRSTLGA
jgi:hypothetical protein